MLQETIGKIEARIKEDRSVNEEKKMELLNLLSTLKTEVSELSKDDAEHARSIAGFAEPVDPRGDARGKEAAAAYPLVERAFRICGRI